MLLSSTGYMEQQSQDKGVTYISQGLLVLENQELVILFRPSVLKDKSKMLNVSQGETVL